MSLNYMPKGTRTAKCLNLLLELSNIDSKHSSEI